MKIFNKWHLIINYQKTKALIFNSKERKQEALDIGGKSIEIAFKVKNLGNVLTSDLRLKDHIEEKRITIINLYKSTNIPSLHHGCKAWNPSEVDKQNLLNIQLSIIRKIVKAPTIYGEIGELPIDFIINKKQIMYLRKLLTSKTQVNYFTKIQLEDPNKNNIVTYIYSLYKK